MIDFTQLEYLKSGSERQQLAYQTLKDLRIFDLLATYQPLLAGTVPLGIDIEDSDLDILLYTHDFKKLEVELRLHFGNCLNFEIRTIIVNGHAALVGNFDTDNFKIELFAQNLPTDRQMAYQHLLIEYEILNAKDENFRKAIIQLKKEGLKTEPAFAKLLGLEGDPYIVLLNYHL